MKSAKPSCSSEVALFCMLVLKANWFSQIWHQVFLKIQLKSRWSFTQDFFPHRIFIRDSRLFYTQEYSLIFSLFSLFKCYYSNNRNRSLKCFFQKKITDVQKNIIELIKDELLCIIRNINDLWHLVKFMFSKKATKIDEIFTVDLTFTI